MNNTCFHGDHEVLYDLSQGVWRSYEDSEEHISSIWLDSVLVWVYSYEEQFLNSDSPNPEQPFNSKTIYHVFLTKINWQCNYNTDLQTKYNIR